MRGTRNRVGPLHPCGDTVCRGSKQKTWVAGDDLDNDVATISFTGWHGRFSYPSEHPHHTGLPGPAADRKVRRNRLIHEQRVSPGEKPGEVICTGRMSGK
jgi:hypothetical protein